LVVAGGFVSKEDMRVTVLDAIFINNISVILWILAVHDNEICVTNLIIDDLIC
jgi:hypothetical protein